MNKIDWNKASELSLIERTHDDSLLDGVSYLSLWADELARELK